MFKGENTVELFDSAEDPGPWRFLSRKVEIAGTGHIVRNKQGGEYFEQVQVTFRMNGRVPVTMYRHVRESLARMIGTGNIPE